MMGPIDRDLIVHFVVASSLCVGGWMIFAQPKLVELKQLESRIAQSQTGRTVDQPQIGRIAEQLGMLSARAAGIRVRSQSAVDSSQLYGVIAALARDHDVVMPSLDSGATARATARTTRTRHRLRDPMVEGHDLDPLRVYVVRALSRDSLDVQEHINSHPILLSSLCLFEFGKEPIHKPKSPCLRLQCPSTTHL